MEDFVGRERRDRVAAQAQQWADALVDFGPYNTLLHFKDTKTTSLDVTSADPQAVTGLLAGRRMRLSTLFPAVEERQAAFTRARSVRRRVLELEEEAGIEAGRLALGLLRVEPPSTRGKSPVAALRAPLLLQPLTIEPRTAAENDFVLEAAGEAEINPVLLYALSRQYGMDGDVESFAQKVAVALDECAEAADRVPAAFTVLEDGLRRSGLAAKLEERVVAGVFSFDRLPMVHDLRTATDLLAGHPVIASLAGDAEATRALAGSGAASSHPSAGADDIPPVSEFLVLDADASQQQVISAALAGSHLVIEGPPGTGKSQTIANLLAVFAALGKRALFVAEKRAAIEAVTDSLATKELHGLVFDLHKTKLSRRQIAQQLHDALEQAGRQAPPHPGDLHSTLEQHRSKALGHIAEFHQVRKPWQISAHQLITHLMGSPVEYHTRLRLRGANEHR